MCVRASRVAMPSGNFSSASSISEGRRYQAIQMPRKLTEKTHAIIGAVGSVAPVSRV
jgi:hypothetical protein